ncbi:hypothetical protein AB4Y43_24730 [Paraburkholderia sp. BR10872]|uniref:hypothetical protein n=1 Tax=Paraburkholderia sp. BR10872 TaxID=3236989 RepID=UPI0034D19B48
MFRKLKPKTNSLFWQAMFRFYVKQIDTPLFGVVENSNQSNWHSHFSAGASTIPVELDHSALDMIAEDLELDIEGLAIDAQRYAQGLYRSKARGLTGSRLGDLGEIISFLTNAHQYKTITRVVSWRAGAGQTVKGSRFPQPDFLVTDTTGLVAALEVKSTELFDFVDWRDNTKSWRFLQPCSSVAGCREQALPQLGFVGNVPATQRHNLVIKDGAIVPFPVTKGIANAVLALDGRMNTLRTDARFRTPPICRSENRSCWDCVPEGCHFVIVKMPNAPGMLSLGGPTENSEGWIHAYARWSKALSSQNPYAVEREIGKLAGHLETWLRPQEVAYSDVLSEFWMTYLWDSMRGRGLETALPQSLVPPEREALITGSATSRLTGPVVSTSTFEKIKDLLSRKQSQSPFVVCAALTGTNPGKGTVTVKRNRDTVEFCYMPPEWWTDRPVQSREEAKIIAEQLLSSTLQLLNWHGQQNYRAYLKEITVKVGERSTHLGWDWHPVPAGVPWESRPWYAGPHWLRALPLGLSGVRLKVRPDGRATLSIPSTLI